ncbi:MAG: 5-formyltetrahydrofolate cyclo-ligase [Verrucomicrobia bacterium]|nr:5-formyltetrahydrofolate cyclo-ligase [Verrucomicrobiota bacterium]
MNRSCVNRELIEKKRSTRAHVREVVGKMSPDDRVEASRRICDRVRRNELWTKAASVMAYCPTKGEVDVWPLAVCAAEEGKILALPRFEPEQNGYSARRIVDLTQTFPRGQFGIKEPSESCVHIPLMQLDLILVPAVAFDLCGARLGRGGGYYDRLLDGIQGVKCGVAFEEQIVEVLAAGKHDIPMDLVVTPTRWITFGRNPASQ